MLWTQRCHFPLLLKVETPVASVTVFGTEALMEGIRRKGEDKGGALIGLVFQLETPPLHFFLCFSLSCYHLVLSQLLQFSVEIDVLFKICF